MCELNDVPARHFEALLSDPLIRLVMASDGVTVEDLREVMETARAALCARALAERPRLTLVD
jgi:hypothetical protein